MTMLRATTAAAAIALGLLSTPALSASAPPPALVLLTQDGNGRTAALARVIVDGADADCPSLRPAGDAAADVGSRGAATDAGSVADTRPMTPRRNPDPAHFPVTVCEARYPTDGTRLAVAGVGPAGADLSLPAVPARVQQVAVIGDTGCSPSEQGGCVDAGQWPFASLAGAIASVEPAPDLIVHVGDYNYRGTPGRIDLREPGGGTRQVKVYDAGDNAPGSTCRLRGPYEGQNSAGSLAPDAWGPWRDDFFTPAADLLRSAPWVVARGNHELCSRAGPGWLYLLDPSSALVPGSVQVQCPPAEAAAPLVFAPPYRVDVGGLSLVVLDSANACDSGDLHQGHFDAQFARVRRLVADGPVDHAVWLVSHRPVWGVQQPWSAPPGGPADPYNFIDGTLQGAFADHPLPRPLHLVLSGHMHLFQGLRLEPTRGRPIQLIVGNGGVALEDPYVREPFAVSVGDGSKAIGLALKQFGYLLIDVTGHGGWRARLLDADGGVLARCAAELRADSGPCVLPQAPVATGSDGAD
jgi:hypothetical protein